MSDQSLDGFIEMQMEISDRHSAELLELKNEMEKQTLAYQRKLDECKRSSGAENNRLLAEIDHLKTKVESYDRFMEDFIDTVVLERSPLALAFLGNPRVSDTGLYIASHKTCPSTVLHRLLYNILKGDNQSQYRSEEVLKAIAKNANTFAEDLRLIINQDGYFWKAAALIAQENPNFKSNN